MASAATAVDTCAPCLTLPEDRRAEFNAYQQALRDEVQPAGAIENEYFNRLVMHGWCARFFRLAETQMLANSGPHTDDVVLEQARRTVARSCRSHERTYDHALKELARLQTARAIRTQPQPRQSGITNASGNPVELPGTRFFGVGPFQPAKRAFRDIVAPKLDLAAAVSSNYRRQS
jgi:hypothetical protein